MWLESWRLGRLLPGLQGLGCDVKEDIVDLEDADMVSASPSSLLSIRALPSLTALASYTALHTLPYPYCTARLRGLESMHACARTPSCARAAPPVLDCPALTPPIHPTAHPPTHPPTRETPPQGPIGLRLLEERRWKQATEQLIHMIRKFDFNDDTRSSVPTLETWLYSLKLEELMEPLDDMGVVELADLADIDDRELASLNLNRLQLKHWKMGLFQALSAREEAALDGKLDMPTFRGWLESWRLGRLKPRMEQLGVYMQQDLLDLEPNEYQLLEMRPLEAKRFEQAMIALEEEFLTPAPDSDQEFRVSAARVTTRRGAA